MLFAKFVKNKSSGAKIQTVIIFLSHLEPLHVLHLCRLSCRHTGVEEGWRDRDAERLRRHSRLRPLAVAVDHAERAKQENQKVLRVDRER